MQSIFTFSSQGSALFKFDDKSTIEWLLAKGTARYAGQMQSEFTIAMQVDGLEVDRKTLIVDIIQDHPVILINRLFLFSLTRK